MKKLLTTLAIAPLFLAAQPALAEVGPWYGHTAYYEAYRPDRDETRSRQTRQGEAVERGVARGTISRDEHIRLELEMTQIERVARAYRSDGRYTAGERAHVSQLQDALARHIRQATNDRGRRY
jgi:hypothetical protein